MATEQLFQFVQVPKESANHIIERRGKPVKADKRVRGRTFQNIMIYQQTGILIPVGSATLGLFTVLYSNESLRLGLGLGLGQLC